MTATCLSNFIKSFERKQRGSSQTFLLSGPKTKTPRDCNGFMSTDENMSLLIKLLLDEWQKDTYANRLVGKKLFFVCGEECFCLSSGDGESVTKQFQEDLCSPQEEADTRINLHCLHIYRHFLDSAKIVVRSTDTDALVLLLKFSTSY